MIWTTATPQPEVLHNIFTGATNAPSLAKRSSGVGTLQSVPAPVHDSDGREDFLQFLDLCIVFSIPTKGSVRLLERSDEERGPAFLQVLADGDEVFDATT